MYKIYIYTCMYEINMTLVNTSRDHQGGTETEHLWTWVDLGHRNWHVPWNEDSDSQTSATEVKADFCGRVPSGHKLVFKPIHRSICLSVFLSIYLSAFLYIHIYIYTHISIHPSIYLSIHLFIYLSNLI